MVVAFQLTVVKKINICVATLSLLYTTAQQTLQTENLTSVYERSLFLGGFSLKLLII